ncbi:hypothetical protein ACFWWT_45145 [Streptomyces sp. NPDC058676]|uniref:ATP-dependent DNA ligase n=1 Tax=unclassified Streptomyces TaxID=2593676 RepID=UPI003659CB67
MVGGARSDRWAGARPTRIADGRSGWKAWCCDVDTAGTHAEHSRTRARARATAGLGGGAQVGWIPSPGLRRCGPGGAALQAPHRDAFGVSGDWAGATQLPDATALDGELVVWDAAGRLAFERLQDRLQRRGGGATPEAGEWPVHFVAFDLLRLSGTDTTRWPYRRRRAALESVFAARKLSAQWVQDGARHQWPAGVDPGLIGRRLRRCARGAGRRGRCDGRTPRSCG